MVFVWTDDEIGAGRRQAMGGRNHHLRDLCQVPLFQRIDIVAERRRMQHDLRVTILAHDA
jgi:hypothetical protein